MFVGVYAYHTWKLAGDFFYFSENEGSFCHTHKHQCVGYEHQGPVVQNLMKLLGNVILKFMS